MEFFRTIDQAWTEQQIQESLTVKNLDEWSNMLFLQTAESSDSGQIAGIWDEFTLRRQLIKGGVRFALIECPNAMMWNITAGYPPQADGVVIHLSVNREAICSEFHAEIEDLLDDMRLQIQAIHAKLAVSE